MNKFIAKSKKVLRELFFTKEGIISWIIVNIIYATPFAIPFIYGFLINRPEYYLVASSAYAFMWLMPMEIITPLSAYFLMRLLWKKRK